MPSNNICHAYVNYLDVNGQYQSVNIKLDHPLSEFLLPQHILTFMTENGCRFGSATVNRKVDQDSVANTKTIDEAFPLGHNPRFQCAIKLETGNDEPWLAQGLMTFDQIKSILNFAPIPKEQKILVNIGDSVFITNDKVRPIHSSERIAFEDMVESMSNVCIKFVVWP